MVKEQASVVSSNRFERQKDGHDEGLESETQAEIE